MMYSNYGEVCKLVSLYETLQAARENAIRYISNVEVAVRDDMNNLELLRGQYGLNISAYSDGSGNKLKLDGCYIAVEVAASILSIIDTKILKVKNSLSDLGVEF